MRAIMCDCMSYNGQGSIGGQTPERVLNLRTYFPDADRETVCVDACIADTIEKLWAAGVKTVACCCGHNGEVSVANGMPNVMIAGPEYADAAFRVLADDPRDWWVQFWAGSQQCESS